MVGLELKDENRKSNRSFKKTHIIVREIRGLFFLLFAVLIGGSLLSYNVSDHLFWNMTGPLGESQNLFGTVGAHLSGGLLDLIGFASFWIVVVCLAGALLSFRGQPFPSPLKNVISVMALLASFSGLLDLQFPQGVFFGSGKIMSGGLLGRLFAGTFENLLNPLGAELFFFTIFVISLMIATNLSLSRLFAAGWHWIGRLMRKLTEALNKRRERKRRSLKTAGAKRKMKAKPKVTISEPPPEPEPQPEQEVFQFMHIKGEFQLPSVDLLSEPVKKTDGQVQRESLEMNARRLEKKLTDFGVEGQVKEILLGPVITMYEYKPAPGIKISKVAGLADDLALTLRAQNIRIVAPIPGKAAIGIEIPNNQRESVYLTEVLSGPAFKNSKERLPIALGKDITGNPVVTDLAKMPHLLVAGATGTGKSVSINTMVISLLFKLSPEFARFLMIDPKRIELSVYHDIPHLLHPVVTQPKDATKALRWTVAEMERRYMLLSDRGFRNIESYNQSLLNASKKQIEDTSEMPAAILPYIIVVIDELADLMMASSREVEEAITRLAQMARAAGIHLIIATQRPSVDVLTGIIKANFPTRISFQVSSKVDSRTILDTSGAEHLLGDGDMLFMPPGVGRIRRIHGPYVSEEEIKNVTDFLRQQGKPDYDNSVVSDAVSGNEFSEGTELDEKYSEAVNVVLKTRQASISMLQRKLRVGYNRAARMIEAMELEGIVGPSDGVRPRDVYGKKEG
jgi:S-DNA-T family DNA segregation ATPase FtsK/SpoIIIE